jgi:hypothetical protein
MSNKPHTHRAYATKREGENVRWLEIGVASVHVDGKGLDLYLDRLPVGGFNGHVLIRSKESPPEVPERSKVQLAAATDSV